VSGFFFILIFGFDLFSYELNNRQAITTPEKLLAPFTDKGNK